MAGSGSLSSAAAANCYGVFDINIIYGRGNYIHEMTCGEVGPHLYSRMCCAGKCKARIFTQVKSDRRSSQGGSWGDEGADQVNYSAARTIKNAPPSTVRSTLKIVLLWRREYYKRRTLPVMYWQSL